MRVSRVSKFLPATRISFRSSCPSAERASSCKRRNVAYSVACTSSVSFSLSGSFNAARYGSFHDADSESGTVLHGVSFLKFVVNVPPYRAPNYPSSDVPRPTPVPLRCFPLSDHERGKLPVYVWL